MQVSKSTIVNAPIDSVWRILRDFNSHGNWHPAVVDSRIENNRPGDAVSSVRKFHLEDGAQLKEQLLSLSDRDYSLKYCLTETPIPLKNYVAEVSLKPVTDTNSTYWQWSASFDTPKGEEQTLKTLVEEEIYQAGFNAIRSMLAQDNQTYSASMASRSALQIPAPTSDLQQSDQTTRYYGFDQPTGESEILADPHTNTDTISLALKTKGKVIDSPAIQVYEYGGPEVLRYQNIAVDLPKENEVRIQQRAIGVNFIDVYCRTGYFGFLQPPGGLGMEAAGEILNVGANVERFKVGDRVAYAAPPVGAYSSVRNIDQSVLIKVPARMTYKTAAAIMLKGMTAEFLLHQVYQLKAGDVILVHAAAGGVGSLLCQWAKTKGAIVIGTVSTTQKAEFASANGCRHPIIYTQESFVERINELTQNHGVDAVFDAIGRKTFGDSIECIRPGGHVVSFGQADEPLGEWDIGKFAAKSLTLSRPNFGHYTDSPEKLSAICNNLFHALENNIIKAHIGHEFALSDAVAAHKALQNRQTIGSTILIPEVL